MRLLVNHNLIQQSLQTYLFLIMRITTTSFLLYLCRFATKRFIHVVLAKSWNKKDSIVCDAGPCRRKHTKRWSNTKRNALTVFTTYQSIMMFCFLYSTVYASVAFVIHLCLLRAESRKIHAHSMPRKVPCHGWIRLCVHPTNSWELDGSSFSRLFHSCLLASWAAGRQARQFLISAHRSYMYCVLS